MTLEELERLTPQRCENGKHADWAADCEHAHACPWCQIEALTTLVESQRKLLLAKGAEPAVPCAVPAPRGGACGLEAGHDGYHEYRSEGLRRSWARDR